MSVNLLIGLSTVNVFSIFVVYSWKWIFVFEVRSISQWWLWWLPSLGGGGLTLYFGRWVPTFVRNWLCPFSGYQSLQWHIQEDTNLHLFCPCTASTHTHVLSGPPECVAVHLYTKISAFELWSFHSSVAEDFICLGNDPSSAGNGFPEEWDPQIYACWPWYFYWLAI
jgi:hypothetical protein